MKAVDSTSVINVCLELVLAEVLIFYNHLSIEPEGKDCIGGELIVR
jgi:hypothetical protein